ncbi:MAG: ImmA/IrrE family metallo-endopeptidase [Planctomycetota bacterium]|jgi:hypothetical protein
MLAEIPAEEFSAALDAVAAEVLRDARVDTPPVDAVSLARALGITVAWDDRQSGRGRYVRLKVADGRAPQPTVLLRPDPRTERRQWAAAHEVGEHVAHRLFHALSVDPREAPSSARESVAVHLAARILLPALWFQDDGPAFGWDLFRLKARYATASHELIARRMLDGPWPVIITIFDHGRVYFRNSNVPGRVPPPSSIEMECQRAAHRDGRPHESLHAARPVRAWPIHEPGWKREILRAEVQWEVE